MFKIFECMFLGCLVMIALLLVVAGIIYYWTNPTHILWTGGFLLTGYAIGWGINFMIEVRENED